MGTFTVKIGVGNMDRGEYVYTDALVDTGSNYSMFPQDFLNDIQVEPFNWQASVVFADGTVHSLPVGPAYLNLQDREGPLRGHVQQSRSVHHWRNSLGELGVCRGPSQPVPDPKRDSGQAVLAQ